MKVTLTKWQSQPLILLFVLITIIGFNDGVRNICMHPTKYIFDIA